MTQVYGNTIYLKLWDENIEEFFEKAVCASEYLNGKEAGRKAYTCFTNILKTVEYSMANYDIGFAHGFNEMVCERR